MADTQISEDVLFQTWEADGSGAEALGALAFKKGEFAEAAAFLKSAGEILPENQRLLAESYLNLWLLDEAFEALKPLDGKRFSRVNTLLGRTHLKAGNADQAVKILKTNLTDDPETSVELGMALEALGQIDEADTIFAGIKIKHPDYFQTLIDQAGKFYGLQLFELSRDCLLRAERVARKDAGIFYQLGIHYMDLNFATEAEAAFKKAIRWRPSPEYYRELATVYEKSNQIDKAMAFSRAPLSKAPDDPLLNAVIANCEFRKGKFKTALERLHPFENSFEDPVSKAEFFNLLGRIYDKLGQPDEAFENFVKANLAMKEDPVYSKLDLQYPYRNTKKYTDMLATGIPKLSEDKPLSVRPRAHVFFMGFPRSGTTLVQTLLESHKSISVIEEKPALRTVIRQLAKFERGYPEALSHLTAQAANTTREIYFLQAKGFTNFDNKTTLVDKLPLNTLDLPLILTLFPEAKIIFAVRNPYASSLSCLMQNFNLNNSMGNLMELDEITNFYSLVMGFWHHISDTLDFDYHTVKYEDLTKDLETEARGLIKFLDLEWDDNILDYANTAKSKGFINTPSYHQVVQPVYTDSVEKWRAYEKYFEPFKDRLKPYCDLFGYSG